MLTLVRREELSEISEEIEILRHEMVALGIRYDFLHPDVQGISSRLDQLLIRFYALAYPNRLLLQSAALESLY